MTKRFYFICVVGISLLGNQCFAEPTGAPGKPPEHLSLAGRPFRPNDCVTPFHKDDPVMKVKEVLADGKVVVLFIDIKTPAGGGPPAINVTEQTYDERGLDPASCQGTAAIMAK